eukprot:TRINITY_DN1204_c0_g1_i4.p1 TRINITY_DN1204_c0_g1~~TRINITY_DN1204_c0_g1_i4.p1  ORF type:complete len:312 (+),score=95.92 TRINITY_DN1204_c0_g1_i4:122-1057(+)
MIRRPPRSTLSSSSAASDVYKRQVSTQSTGNYGRAMGCGASNQPAEDTKSPSPPPAKETPNKAPVSPPNSEAVSPILTPKAAPPSKAISLIVTGPPASSKGKLIKEVVGALGLRQINTVGVVRWFQSARKQELKAAEDEGREPRDVPGAKLADQASACSMNGESIPADTMAELLQLRLAESDCADGWILDGYPRDENQAKEMLARTVVPSKIIVVKLPDQVLLDNQCHRRIDPQDSQIYDIRDEIDEDVKQRLVLREQDQEEVVKAKIEQYAVSTRGMISVFDQSLVVEVDGSSQDPVKMLEQVQAALDEK